MNRLLLLSCQRAALRAVQHPSQRCDVSSIAYLTVQIKRVSPLAAVHTLGNLLTNVSLGRVAVSFTHTIKASALIWTPSCTLPIDAAIESRSGSGYEEARALTAFSDVAVSVVLTHRADTLQPSRPESSSP